jgi:hypothetical protein
MMALVMVKGACGMMMDAAYLSPRPWAMMTVAVCFLAAGTTRAGAAILWIATILLALMGCLYLSEHVVSYTVIS